MKKISSFLLLLVLLGAGVVSFWVYQKYFKVTQASVIAFQVSRGDLRETVNVRGEVASQKEFELEFPFGGTVERIFAKEGVQVKSGDPLMKLDTKELDFERGRLSAVLKQGEASLSKLLGGAEVEELRVSEARVTAGEQALQDARNTLLDAVTTSFTFAEDSIHNKADLFFNDPKTQNASFNQSIANSQFENSLEANRVKLEAILTEWSKALPTDISRVSAYAKTAQEHLAFIKLFLLDLSTAINGIVGTGSAPSATFDSWKAGVLIGRTAVDGAYTSVVLGEEKVRSAESALALAKSELALKKSKPQSEDVIIAEAQIEQAKNSLAGVDERIRKSTLRAPGNGTVKKLMLEEKEIFKPGMTSLVFASTGYKIQADVSELDISKVRYVNGNDAVARFDAFPGKAFSGKVVFIEPKEVIKNEDVYFRTNIFLEPTSGEEEIRSGMSADVVLHGVLKKNILTIPELAVEKREGKSFVKVASGATTKEEVDPKMIEERVVVTGISDGESVEIISGLSEGEVVVVSAD